MSKTKLKSCPFCGGQAKIDSNFRGARVICENRFNPDKLCPVNMRTRSGQNEEQAIELWNTRTDDSGCATSEEEKTI